MVTLSREHESSVIPDNAWVGNSYKMEFYWLKDRSAAELRSLQERAAWINDRVFHLNPLQTADEIRHHMKRERGSSFSSILIATADDRDVAFCIQHRLRVVLPDGEEANAIFTDLRATEVGLQGQGIGTEFLNRSYEMYGPLLRPRYYAGRTQDERVVASLQRSGLFGKIHPIQKRFEEGSIPQRVMLEAAGGVIYPVPVDRITGVVKGVYPEGRAAGDTLDLSRPRIRRLHNSITRLVDQDNGDAFFYVAELKQFSDLSARAVTRLLLRRRVLAGSRPVAAVRPEDPIGPERQIWPPRCVLSGLRRAVAEVLTSSARILVPPPN